MRQKPIVFFIRNRPQGADIIELNLKQNRVFVGYPPFKKGKMFDEKNIKSCVFDISKDTITKDDIEHPKYISQVTKNINLVKDAVIGSFVIVTRPARGLYYIGKIKRFELVNSPEWINDYKEIRLNQKLSWEIDGDNRSHVGDIVQSWIVEKFIKVSPFRFPAWVRYSLFGRSSVGRIRNHQAYDIISKLYSGIDINVADRSLEDKLLYFLSPDTFEHFMCNLLLFEHKHDDQIWMHIGGPGDGGIDCIGIDKKTREVVGIAQCKLKNQTIKEMKDILRNLNQVSGKEFTGKKYICNFYCTESIKDGEDLEILNQERIIRLFEKHKESNYWEII